MVTRTRKSFVAVCAGLVTALSLSQSTTWAQTLPREKTLATINGKKITIEYARPQTKSGKVFGVAVPYGQIWHPGNALLTTEAGLKFGNCTVAAGSYKLFAVPNESTPWELIVAKQQALATPYDKSLELCREKMDKGSSGIKEPWRQVTILIIRIPTQPMDFGISLLRVAWGEGEAEIMFKM